MSPRDRTLAEIADRWRPNVILKSDVFSTIERGHFQTSAGEVEAVLRRIDRVPWWTRALARHLLRREMRALRIAGPLGVGPTLLHAGRRFLVRGWIAGVPLHLARPSGDRDYFRSAKTALRKLHRAGVTHNDLAKEQNWLRTADGRAALTDFQLAMRFRRRNFAFRVAAYEDLRHLLKHKRRYASEALSAAERRILARKSLPTRIWMATGKKVYFWLTRGILHFADREGGGPRLVTDAPRIAAALKANAAVRDAAIVAFPERRAGTALYAFVETQSLNEEEVRTFLDSTFGKKAPERLQVVASLPRNAKGEVRTEILQLIAMNQIDLIDALVTDESERRLVAHIVSDRRNMRDRFAF